MVFDPNSLELYLLERCDIFLQMKNHQPCSYLREDQQKTFVTLSGFWSLRGWGGGGVSESVKKKNLSPKSFFQIMLNEVLKICEQ